MIFGKHKPSPRPELDDTMEALRWACEQHPNQRVGQVISNAMNSKSLFYVKDADLESKLYDYGEGRKPR